MFAQINGTRIYFDVEGVGLVPDGPVMRQKPVCFILHGGPGGDHSCYKNVLTPLTEYMQLVYIDNRGSGRSAKGPQSTYTMETNADDLEALRQYLGIDKVILMGQSYGGMVAQAFAIKYPDSLEALILLTTTPSYRFMDAANAILEEKGTPEQKEMAKQLFEGAVESDENAIKFFRTMAPLYSCSYKPATTPEAKQMEEDGVSREIRSIEALNEGFSGFLRSFDFLGQLPSVSVPTLVIGGRHDWITPVGESIQIAEKIPGSELVIFEHSSHYVMADENELFFSTIKDFVSRKVLGH